MTKFCPNCKAEIEMASLSCKCGHVFVDEIEMTRSAELENVHHLRRDRIIKRTVIFTCCAAFALTFAAWIGGFISTAPVVADSEVSHFSDSQPLIDAAQPPAAVVPARFPEMNVPYTASKAVTGAVFEVADAASQPHRVTIYGIRVPKMDENYGYESRASLSTFVTGKPVMIKLRRFTKDVDTIAEVYCEGANIGLEQVRTGMAWLVPEELVGLSEPEQKDYLDAAAEAKSGKLGLWSGKLGVDPLTGEPGQWTPPSTVAGPPVVASSSAIPRSFEASPKKPLSFTNRRQSDAAYAEPPYPSGTANIPRPAETAPVAVKKEPAPAPAAPPDPAPSKRTYIRGPFGGCYYINKNGNKSYVDRSVCD